MRPVLFHVPFLDVPYHAYGFFLAVAFLFGMALAVREGKRQGFDGNAIVTLAFICIVASLAGSRLLHLLMVERAAFFANPGLFFEFTRGGYAFYGGFLAALLAAWIYCRVRGWGFLQVFDIYTPGVAFGLMFGRTGCLLAGCCHGRRIEEPLPDWLASVIPLRWPEWFSLTFPAEAGGLGSIHDHPLVPTQPLSGLAVLAVFLVLVLVVLPRKRFHGQIFVWFCLLYAVARSTVELLRGDARGLYFDEALSTSQLVSVPVVLIGLAVLVWARMRIDSGAMEPLPADWREQSRLRRGRPLPAAGKKVATPPAPPARKNRKRKKKK